MLALEEMQTIARADAQKRYLSFRSGFTIPHGNHRKRNILIGCPFYLL